MNNKNMCAIAIAVFFISLYSLFSIGHYGGDGYEDYLTAKSIVLNHSMAFNSGSSSGNPSNIDELNYKKDAGVKGKDGKMYSSRGGLVIPVILSFFYCLGHTIAGFFKNVPHEFITMFFVSFSNPLILAVNCLLIFLISLKLSFSARTSVALTFIYGLATMAPVYARTGFAEPALTLFILLPIYLILKYKRSANGAFLLLAGSSAALSVFVKSIAAIFLPFIALYAIWIVFEKRNDNPSRIKDGAIFFMPLLAILALIGIFNYLIYGGIFKFGGKEAMEVTDRVSRAPHFIKGLYYYLLSTGKGFFIFNLPIILSFIGLAKVSARRRKESILFILLFLANLIFFTMSFRRGSLFAWGPRYLFPSLPFLIFLIGDFIENNKGFIGRLSASLLSIAGFFMMLPCMFVNQSKFYFFVKEKLGLPEYIINFIPDLSPVLGAWKMFISRIIFIARSIDMPFIYNPDYRLVSPISSSMTGYNNFDFWFLKIINLKPEYATPAFVLIAFMIITIVVSLTYIIHECSHSNT